MKGTIPQGLGSYTRPASLETHPPPAQIATPPLQVSGTARPLPESPELPQPTCPWPQLEGQHLHTVCQATSSEKNLF